jgi:hypothetical protein
MASTLAATGSSAAAGAAGGGVAVAATQVGAAGAAATSRRGGDQVGAHLAHKADHLFERVVVAQVEVIAARNVEGLAQGDEGLGLLDSVDAQVGLQVEV